MPEFQELGRHLEELRRRALRIVLVFGGIAVFVLTFHAEPAEVAGIVLYYPVPDPLNNMAAQITDAMRDSLVPSDVELIQTAPGQAFFAQVYVAVLVGIVAGMPAAIRESAAFLRPALRESEMGIGRAVTVPALALFAGGCVFSYAVVIPYTLDFLYRIGESAGIVAFLNVMDFVTFVLQFLLAFGVSFQLPMIMYGATASGMISAGFWRRNIRYAAVAMVVFGAVITPDGSGITMWFVTLPMIGLYAAGMILVERRGRQKAGPPAPGTVP